MTNNKLSREESAKIKAEGAGMLVLAVVFLISSVGAAASLIPHDNGATNLFIGIPLALIALILIVLFCRRELKDRKRDR